MPKYKAEITAYYPSNEGVEGGYLDALGNKLNPNYALFFLNQLT